MARFHLFGSLCLLISAAPVVLGEPGGQVLFRDRFEATVTQGGATYTKADLIASSATKPGGRITGPVELVAGKVGKALRLHGQSQVVYLPAKGLIDPAGGELSFWVSLNFDPMEKNDKTRTVLRNQSFIDIWDMSKGHTKLAFYNASQDSFAAAVFNADRNIAMYAGFRQVWKPNEWHHVSLRWGKTFEVWVDGEKKASEKWNGLFGPLPVDLEQTRIVVGTEIGWSNIESEFAMDELQIKGPSGEQISSRPRMPLPLLSETPELDGRLDDAFWAKASRVSGFVGFLKNELVERQPVLYAAYTAQGLYCAVEVTLPGTNLPRAMLTEHDSAVYQEDSVEIFLQPAGYDGYYQFIASAAGTKLEAKGVVGKPANIGTYNPEWQVKTSSEPGKWRAEVFIPFAALDVAAGPAAGQVWKANVCIDSSSGFSNAALWSFSPGVFNQPMFFGDLLFMGKERAVRQETFGGFRTGEPQVVFSLIGDFQPIITIKGELTDGTGKAIYKNSMHFRDTKSIQFRPPYLTTGTYRFVLSGTDETGLDVFYQNLGFQTAKSFDFTLENYPYAGYVQFKADTKGVKGAVGKVVFAITGPDGKSAGGLEVKELTSGMGEGRFPNGNLVPGAYTVEAQAVSPDGKVLEQAKQTFTVFAKPDWWNNTLGLDHSVPPPYEPVKATPDGLAVWGREFIFGKSVFPRQLRNQGKDLFVRAPRFVLKADGGSVDLGTLEGTRAQSHPDAATVTAGRTVGNVALACTTTVEFDGFLRFDLTLTPTGTAKVEELTLAIPLAKDLASLMLNSNGMSSQSVALDKGFRGGFSPFIWIGNDDMGLSWFAESDEFWAPKDNQMLEVVQGTDEAVLKINMIREALTLSKPVTISFGLMATPVRPIPKNDPFAFPSYHERGNITFSEFLTYPLAKNIRPEAGTLEFWVKGSGRIANDRNTQLFQIRGNKKALTGLVLTPGEKDTFALNLDQKRLLTVKAPILSDAFGHLALTWDKDRVSCYWNGKLAASVAGPAVAEMKEAFVGDKGKIIFGAYDDRYGFTGVILDEIRISSAVRYTGDGVAVPEGPFEKDADCLVLDHLDDSFRPDGTDAETMGGGVPSIGSVFVPAKFGNGLKMEVAPPRPAVEVLAEFGIKILTHWAWTPEMVQCYGQPWLDSPTIDAVKDEVADDHRHGLPVVPYLAYPAITNTSGYIEKYGGEWGIKPVSTTPWQLPGSPEGYYFLNCCLGARSYADYFAAFLVRTMDKFDFDGFYSDGLTQVPACQNEAHGCGYTDAGGGRRPTWRVFAVRDTLKRMYRIVKSKKPDGWVVNHASFNMIVPVLSFSDIVYTGEHEDYENLLTARVRFNSDPWGLYVTLLGSSEHAWSSVHAMMPLLNGTSVWGTGVVARGDQGRKDYALRKVYAAFDTKSAVWVPWFKGENVCYTVADPKVKASFYYHEGKDVLLLAANFNAEAKTVDLKLDPAKLGLSGRTLKAVNTLTDQKIDVAADGTVKMTIKPKSFLLIKID